MASFATTADVSARLGRALTTFETDTQVPLLLELTAGLIADACDQDADWATALDPVPINFRMVTIEAVVRSIQNPSGARQLSQQLGAFSHSASYDAGALGLMLTADEIGRVRRAIFGRSSGSVRVGSMLDDIYPDTDSTLDDE